MLLPSGCHVKVFKSPAHPRRGYSANNVAAATPLSLPPESLPSFCCDNFTVMMLNKATLQDQPGMWSQGSWHCTKTEQLIGFLLLLSSLQFLAWIFLSYFAIFLDNHIYRGGPSCVKVSFTRKTDFFRQMRYAQLTWGSHSDYQKWEICIGLMGLQRIPQIT